MGLQETNVCSARSWRLDNVSIRYFLRLVALIAPLLLLAGCLFDGGSAESGRRGASLSQAMERSASADRAPVGRSPSDPKSDHGSPLSLSFLADSGGAGGGETIFENDSGFSMQLQGGCVVPFNSCIRSISTVSFSPLAFTDDHNLFGLYVAGGSVDFREGSLADQGAKDPWALEAGLFYRRYLNGPKTFLSPYLAISAGCQGLYWTYRNDIVSGADTIHGDNLLAGTGYAGFGVALQRKHHLSLFAEGGFGGTVFANQTSQGFANDLFSAYGFFAVKAGLSYRF
jgi:hypothetical protein